MRREPAGVRLGLAEVFNPSMVPTLRPGDRMVVLYGARVRPGDVVVVRHPFQHDLLIVKRAAERRDGGWWVRGDNPYVPNDSREFGVVPDGLVVARAVLRLRGPRGAGDGLPGPGASGASGVPGGQRARVSPAALVRWLTSAVRPLSSRSRRLRAR
ncbi:nickel-type superoxide dismutase maturation protease [Streptomyces sp. 6N223]|uniref:nickel-type superoxide dismutase maturation protease n=1 Tax=Streptomyces sp. 6N223 TaxID=3457412 RepID=UPI003FD06D1A